MNADTFVYVTYIATTPDKVWNALIDGEITRQYWGGNVNVPAKGWNKGSPWKHVSDGGKGAVKCVGEVLEVVPQKRLVLSWSDPGDESDPAKVSRVALELETVDAMVRLTVTHEHLTPAMAKKISGGWPLVCASLKSLLETGTALKIFSTCAQGANAGSATKA